MSNSRELLGVVETVMRSEIQRLFSEVRVQAAGDDEWSARTLEWLEEYCLRPGKGIRPALVAAGAAAARSQSLPEVLQDEGVRRAMLLTALLHKRLLMADDVADRDELRNDEPAYHVMLETWLESHPNYANLSQESRAHYARSYTEVSGLWLQEMVTMELVALQRFLPSDRWQQLAQDFDRHSYQRTLAGWFTLLDQNLEVLDEKVSRERFLRGLEMITSDYTFVSPLLVGSAFGPENTTLRQVAIEYGHQVGIIFQLSDDVLGLYGDPSVTGKPVGGDVREGKKTLLMQEAYKLATAEDKQRLQKLVGKPDLTEEETNWVRTFVKESGAWDAVQTTISEYVGRAQQAVQPWPDEATRSLLHELISVIATRNK
jgi:geranylgeranyl diphosphate synthase type I